jgi:hypothetical protein
LAQGVPPPNALVDAIVCLERDESSGLFRRGSIARRKLDFKADSACSQD